MIPQDIAFTLARAITEHNYQITDDERQKAWAWILNNSSQKAD